MRYKQVTNKGTNLYYIYICRTHHADITACPKKYLHETKLKEVLWAALQHEIKLCGDTQKLMDEYSHSPAAVCGDGVLERQILHVRQGLARTKSLYDNLYPSYVDRLIDEREYMELKSQYRREMERAQAAMRIAILWHGKSAVAYAGISLRSPKEKLYFLLQYSPVSGGHNMRQDTYFSG